MKPRSVILEFLDKNHHAVFLLCLLAITIFFRFWQLGSLPPGLHPDEAANGLDIFRILEQKDFRPVYDTNGPRESLFFFLQAIPVAILGNSILALRIVPALVGVFAVIFTYLWAKAWFGRRVAYISALFMAVNPWTVTITRDGFRASMTPLFVALALWLYTKAVRTLNKRWWIASGVVTGLGMYTYLAFKLFPLALGTMLVFFLIKRHELWRKWSKLMLTSLVAFAITVAPLFYYSVRHPEINARTGGTSFLNKDLNGGQPLRVLTENAIKTAGMFNLKGDENYRHNMGGQPLLNTFAGVMFLLGLLVSLGHLFRPRHFALISVFFVMLLPELLTAEGIPHALRAYGAVGPTMILAGLGTSEMLQRWFATFPINSAARSSGLAAISLLLMLSIYHGYQQYFVAWAKSPQTYEAYSEDAVAVGNFLNNEPFAGERIVVIDGYSDITVQYLTHNKKSAYTRVDPSAIKDLPANNQAKQFVIVSTLRDASLAQIRAKYPGGKLGARHSSFNDAELFLTYQTSQ